MGFMFGYVIVSTQEVDNKSNNIYLWFLEFNIKAILCNDRGEGHGDIVGAVKEGVQVQFTASKSSLSAPLSFPHSIPRKAVNSSPERREHDQKRRLSGECGLRSPEIFPDIEIPTSSSSTTR